MAAPGGPPISPQEGTASATTAPPSYAPLQSLQASQLIGQSMINGVPPAYNPSYNPYAAAGMHSQIEGSFNRPAVAAAHARGAHPLLATAAKLSQHMLPPAVPVMQTTMYPPPPITPSDEVDAAPDAALPSASPQRQSLRQSRNNQYQPPPVVYPQNQYYAPYNNNNAAAAQRSINSDLEEPLKHYK
jgi:hypothetical protein